MDSSPLISIVMPCYQQAAFLEEAVRSVLDQQGVDVELIAMDPGSTDGSRELLLELKRKYGERLVLTFAPDRGQADAVNRGMQLTRGRVLGWLNSDDRLCPSALRLIAPYLDSDEPRWAYGYCGIIDDVGKPIFRGIVWYKNIRGKRFSIYKLLTEAFIPQPAAFWNLPMWKTAGGVDMNRHLDPDYDLFLSFARIAKPKVFPVYLADFRVHRDAKSSLRTFEAIDHTTLTARKHAEGLGIRGKLALMIHMIYNVRTKVIYRLIKS